MTPRRQDTHAPRATARSLVLALAGGIAAAVACGACAHGISGSAMGSASAPAIDSATVALWRLDEPGGYSAADLGLRHLDLRAGVDTGTDFGRFRGARSFTRSIDSFLYAPWPADLDPGAALSIDAWIEPSAWGAGELTPLVARWSPPTNDLSWLFGIVGSNLTPTTDVSPGLLTRLVELGAPGHLAFVLQPADAGLPLTYYSSVEIDLDRWSHVAVTYDGAEVRFYVDGRLDSQFASGARIRASRAPLLIGNFFDTRWIVDLGAGSKVGPGAVRTTAYAYEGLMDEIRISDVARQSFGVHR